MQNGVIKEKRETDGEKEMTKRRLTTRVQGVIGTICKISLYQCRLISIGIITKRTQQHDLIVLVTIHVLFACECSGELEDNWYVKYRTCLK